ncbi:MAG: hypothetical protein ABIT83_26665, partial [Massilia sp.]
MKRSFLTRLGLDRDADTRAIRRAYARELKLIDQERDGAGFQVLREAYEAALRWAETSSGAQAPSIDLAPTSGALASETEPELDGGNGAGNGEREGEGETNVAPAPHYGVPLSATQIQFRIPTAAERTADPRFLARAAYDQFLASVDLAGLREDDGLEVCERTLRAQIDDPMLLNIAARGLFEHTIATKLADGWERGHEYLLIAAQRVFHWADEQGRLRHLGEPGAIIDEAIEERAQFNCQHSSVIIAQREIIGRLRGGAPEAVQLRRDMLMVERMAARFPNWLSVIVDINAVVEWRRLYQQAGGTPITQEQILRPQPQPEATRETASSWSFAWPFFMALFML